MRYHPGNIFPFETNGNQPGPLVVSLPERFVDDGTALFNSVVASEHGVDQNRCFPKDYIFPIHAYYCSVIVCPVWTALSAECLSPTAWS